MTELQLLSKFKNDAAKLSLYISRKFASLTPEQINFRPIADKWSVGECFEHLIISHRLYYDKLSAIIEKNNLKGRKEDKEVFHTFFGKKIISAVKPDSSKKIKTFKVFKPLSSELNDEVFERFILLQNKFVKLCDLLQNTYLSKTKLSSPVSKIIRLNTADILLIIIHHNNRHIHQAAQIVDLCFFPKEPHKNGNSKK